MLARLFGMPLLRVRADVVLVPVRLREAAPPALVPAAGPAVSYSLQRPAPGRASLDEARRLVGESERDLRSLCAPNVPSPPR